MGKLSAFLKPSPAGKTKEVYISRFTDEEGRVAPIVVKSITAGENELISRRCRDRKGSLDAIAYGNQLMVACVVEPDLKNAELCQHYGVIDPCDVPGVMFTTGEKQKIQDAIMEINDIKDEDERFLEAKNS